MCEYFLLILYWERTSSPCIAHECIHVHNFLGRSRLSSCEASESVLIIIHKKPVLLILIPVQCIQIRYRFLLHVLYTYYLFIYFTNDISEEKNVGFPMIYTILNSVCKGVFTFSFTRIPWPKSEKVGYI